jgi:hypothetical protein
MEHPANASLMLRVREKLLSNFWTASRFAYLSLELSSEEFTTEDTSFCK